MPEPSKGKSEVRQPSRGLHSLASKFSVFSGTLVFWVVAMFLGYDLHRENLTAGKGVLILAIIVLVSAALSRFTTRLLARPLARLQAGIVAVENSRLEAIQVSQTGDEIQFLGESFNRMIEALNASRAQVQEHQEILERRIKERTEQLENALLNTQRANEAKSEFVANVSHELRTPMSGVIGMLAIALDQELPPELREQLQTAQHCAQSLLMLLNDLLDLSKMEAGKMTIEKVPLNLRALLRDCIQSHQPQAAENQVQLGFEVSTEVPEEIAGDPLRIRQILWNLVGNAVKFTEHGEVRVRIEHSSAGHELSTLQVTVQDTGTGIPPDKLLSIFDKFHQADSSVSRKFGGTGLGLAITKKLVELQNGELRVESELGHGSKFIVTLPYDAHERRVNPAREPASQARPGAGRARILVVEDNPVNQKVVTGVLGKRGYSLEVANDGREAIAKLEQDRAFDLILMDVQMPVLDGLEATRMIRKDPRWKNMPIVAMTAHAMTGDKENCLEAGMDDYVSKPVSPDRLLRVVEEYLIQSRASRALI